MIHPMPIPMKCCFFYILILRTHFILLGTLEDVVESLGKVFGESRSKHVLLYPKLVSGLSYNRINDV